MANAKALELWDRKEEEVITKPVFDILLELESQGIREVLDGVYQTGKPFTATELPVQILRNGQLETVYINFIYEPLHDSDGNINGVITLGSDVTSHVLSRRKIEESEQKLNVIITASELGTWELDFKTDELFCSGRYVEIFGYHDDSEHNHRLFINHIHPDDRPIRDKAFKEALKSSILYYEVRVIWNDGTVHWIEAKGKVFYDEKRQPLKMIGTIRDITEEKNHQQDLKESEEKFRLLADSVPQFVWTADQNGSLNYFNQSVRNYSGLASDYTANGRWLEVVHPDDREENMNVWMESVATGKDFLFEHRFRRFDGEYRWQLSRAVAQKDASGEIQMWVGSSTDIQEIKVQEQQKDYFISVASHELKTPITSIKGYVQILKRKYSNSDDPFLKNSLTVIDKQITTLTTLVTELLDLSKIKSGRLVLKKSHFAINLLVKEVIDEIIHIYPDYIISFETNAETMVNADRDRIGQVLINFLTNAVKYSPKSYLIKVMCNTTGNNVIVSVEDSGIGISRVHQDRIFERFFRVEGKNERSFPGFGIGLYIAAEIVERHEGNIGVKSEEGHGSTFYFSIPVD
jgi:PAS domain S-box-containing protein